MTSYIQRSLGTMSRPASISLRAITISSEPVQLRRTIEKDRA